MNLEATEYHNSPERFPEFRRKLFLRSTFTVALIIVFSFVMFFFAGDRDYFVNLTIPIIYLLFFLLVLAFSLSRNLKRQKALYFSHKLVITANTITREQTNLTPLTISLDAIKAVKQNAWGNLEIRGSSPYELIVISKFTDRFDEIRNWLENRYSISIQKSRGPLLNYLVIAGTLTIMLIFYLAQNKIVVALSGIIILATLIWSLYFIQTATVIEKRTKRLSWWAILVILSVAGSAYFRLFPIS